ncbi:hypothetical protein [Prosthecomicrobium sp. N25]|uniref:hypothetical protein n=1 Tax=Prosthecomicrobium sp. N25 TaxID=3129254 RepID=UPI003078A10E
MFRSLDLRVVLAGVVALGFVTFDHPQAQLSGVNARLSGDTIAVDAVFQPALACWSVDTAREGKPEGARTGAGTVAVTVSLDRSGEPCTGPVPPVRASLEVPARPDATSVLVFFVDETGKVVWTEKGRIRT